MQRSSACAVLVFACLAAGVGSAQFQITSNAIPFPSFSGTFEDISAPGSGGIALTGVGDDTVTTITTTVGNIYFPSGSVAISNNGVMVAGSSVGVSFNNDPLPAAGLPPDIGGSPVNAALCPFWDDLFPGTGGANATIYWKESNGVLTVLWKDEDHYIPSQGAITFEVKVYGTNNPFTKNVFAQFFYPDTDFVTGNVNNSGGSATIGYVKGTNAAAPYNIQWSYNSPTVPNGTVLSLIAPPTNDDCSGAIPVSDGAISFDTSTAFFSSGSPSGCILTFNDVWFVYTQNSACDRQVTVSACGTTSGDTTLRVFAGTCGNLTGIACDDDFCGAQSRVTFTALPGQPYYLACGTFDVVGFPYGVNITSTAAISQSVGPGCGSPAPSLTTSPPILGGSFTTSISNATAGASGMVYFGAPGAPPMVLGGSCVLYLSPASLNPLFPVNIDAAGNWSQTIGLPPVPGLDCVEAVFQGVVGSTNGINLTNGQHIRLSLP